MSEPNRETPRHAEKSTTEEPQEEFISQESVPSHDEKSAPAANPEKPTEQWVTGNEPMTGPQHSYLQTLCREAGEDFDEKLTKAEASKRIEELQKKTGRGTKT